MGNYTSRILVRRYYNCNEVDFFKNMWGQKLSFPGRNCRPKFSFAANFWPIFGPSGVVAVILSLFPTFDVPRVSGHSAKTSIRFKNTYKGCIQKCVGKKRSTDVNLEVLFLSPDLVLVT